MLHLLCQVWSLVAGNRCSGAPENHQTVCNPFWIFKDASSEPYVTVNLANGFRRQFHHQYFWITTYQQCEWGILIYQQSQLHLSDAQAQCPVYQSWPHGRDTVVSCPSRLVWYWLGESYQPNISYRSTAQLALSPSSTPPPWSKRFIFLLPIPTATSFEINSCPQHV
jgi:hypothetical protein